jgi:nitrogen fixation protein NifU and related proteins
MSDLSELYSQLILEHDRAPRNHGPLAEASHTAQAHNPLCGDRIRLALRVEQGVIAEARFEGRGCAISRASGSLMTEALVGLSAAQAEQLAGRFHELLTPDGPATLEPPFSALAVFSHVRDFPTRIRCAELAWETLLRALRSEPVVPPVTGDGGPRKVS